MIAGLPYKDRSVAVLGLARSGRAAALSLRESGARVLAWDDSAASRDAAAAAQIPIVDLAAADPADWAALVMSPGIPLTHPAPHPVAARAAGAGVPVIGDIELLWQADTGAGFIGITGTNGKSTTTALIGHILAKAGAAVAVGGNLGIPVLELPRLGESGRYVIEMSSFQLDLIDQTRFGIGLLLNVTPDHLDRHGDMAGYVAAKSRLFARQQAGDTAIIGIDDESCRTVADTLARGPARLIRISAEGLVPGGIGVRDGFLVDGLHEELLAVMDLRGVATLPGRHNWQNAAAAYAACRAAGIPTETIAAAIQTYPGLPHRQELVGTLGQVRFVNDSKATNADAAAKALGCYDRIYWIAGGKAKAGGIAALAPWFDRVAHAYLIGEAAEDFAATLAGTVETSLSGDLKTAIEAAALDARRAGGPAVVLLSPACASYDQFAHFEARGDAFRQLAKDLIGRSS
jgi:UDP-N-acetylmuramoylalanine--D-glutamate ligase